MSSNVMRVVARRVAADGVTPVPGKPALAAGSDYTASYDGAPDCASQKRQRGHYRQ